MSSSRTKSSTLLAARAATTASSLARHALNPVVRITSGEGNVSLVRSKHHASHTGLCKLGGAVDNKTHAPRLASSHNFANNTARLDLDLSQIEFEIGINPVASWCALVEAGKHGCDGAHLNVRDGRHGRIELRMLLTPLLADALKGRLSAMNAMPPRVRHN